MLMQVTTAFDSWIRTTFAGRDEACRFLLNHERKPRCITFICDQIHKAEMSNIGGRFELSRFTILIEACAKMFCEAALKLAEEQAYSSAERQRLVRNAGYLDEIRGEFREMSDEATRSLLVSRPGSVAK